MWYSNTSLGQPEFMQQLNELRKTTGTVLRIDHTYKVTKALGVKNDPTEGQHLNEGKTAKKKRNWVPLKASLLLILSETNHVKYLVITKLT
jgi:ribosomal protein L35